MCCLELINVLIYPPVTLQHHQTCTAALMYRCAACVCEVLFILSALMCICTDQGMLARKNYVMCVKTCSTCRVLATTLRLQASGNERQNSLLKCLIHSMYDEIRFLHDYPDHELDRTARLLGAVIRNG